MVESGGHMEPMVVGALGIVGYSAYLTWKDLAADLRREGILPARIRPAGAKKISAGHRTTRAATPPAAFARCLRG